MLSMLMQVTTVFTLIVVLWAIYGYSLALTEGNPIIGGLSQLFLAGTTADSTAGTFTDGIVLPETIFIAFQSTFAGLTCALIVGSMAERAKVCRCFNLCCDLVYFLLRTNLPYGMGSRRIPFGQRGS